MAIYITWPDDNYEMVGWATMRDGSAEPLLKATATTRKALWSDDVTPENIASAKAYVANMVADGDTRKLKVSTR